jgi:hypothetical protein
VGLNFSAVGYTHQLYRNAIPIGGANIGINASLDFGLQAIAGVYTVIATNTATGCTNPMAGSAVVTVNPLPTVFSVTGGGSYCAGGAGLYVDLLASTPIIVYQLFLGTTPVGSPISGTGAALNFGMLTMGGTYSVVATSAITGCSASMAGGPTISLLRGSCTGMPVAGTVTASAFTFCSGLADTLKLNGCTNVCGITFQWQTSSDSMSWADVSGAQASQNTFFPTAAMYYRCAVKCTSSGLTAYSTVLYIALSSGIYSHRVISSVDTICNPPDFYISACGVSSTYNVTTYYGDGTHDNTPLTATGICHAHCYHSYSAAGTYTVKQVLNNGSSAIDSIVFEHNYFYCSIMPVSFFHDVNTNCVFDSGEAAFILPVLTEIDSSGIPIDTISATSGFYITAKGPVGTIYGFKVLPMDGFTLSCLSSPITYDTVHSFVNSYSPKYIGITCGSETTFDLNQSITINCGRHLSSGYIVASNARCFAKDAIVSLTFSPKYEYASAYPTPLSHSENTITWSLASLSAYSSSPAALSFSISTTTSGWLLPGDTIQTRLVISPTAGDFDSSNNVSIRVDTVKSSYDPNEISVMPEGSVLPCTPLRYTINFENTGNDIAHNIYVMDTLSDNLDPRTLRIIAASSIMNIALLRSGGHNIVKFDFPGINLLDSSHHNRCDGMVVFTIKTKTGLPDGAAINNIAGIFFDDNPVVMTNSVNNTIGISPITGPGNACAGSTITLINATAGGTWSLANGHASLGSPTDMPVTGKVVNALTAGIDTLAYTVTNTCTSRMVKKAITINALPAPITGSGHVCIGSNASLASVTAGGRWSGSNTALATIDSVSGAMAGLVAGTDTIAYSLTTGCVARSLVTINALPTQFAITGGGQYCAGGTAPHIQLASSTPAIHYQLYHAGTTAGGVINGTGAALDFGSFTATGTYTVKATDPVTSCVQNMASPTVIISNSLPITYTVTGGAAYCAGDTGAHIRLSGSASGINYQLYAGPALVGGALAGTGSSLDFGLLNTAGTYTVSATNATTGCTGNMIGSGTLTINSLPVSFTVTGGGHYCAGGVGDHIYLTGSGVGVSYQLYNGTAIGIPATGTGATLDFGPYLPSGTYTVLASNTVTGCIKNMAASAVIVIDSLPMAYAVTGGGSHCAGGAGVHVGISNSAAGIYYQAYNTGAVIGSIATGTGAALDMGLFSAAGAYTIVAIDSVHHCTNEMTGSTVVSIVPAVIPAVSITSDAADSLCQGTVVTYLATTLNGGAGPVLQWKVNGVNAGTGSSFSYIPQNADLVTAKLTSNATCALPDTAGNLISMVVDSAYMPIVSVSHSAGAYLAVGAADTFTAVVSGAGPNPTFLWKINGNSIPGFTTAVFIYSGFFNNDVVTCEVKCSTICGALSVSNPVAITLHSDGVSILNGGEAIALFPNPNSGIFTLKGNLGPTCGSDLVSVEIKDVLGRVVYKSQITPVNGIVNQEINLGNTLRNGAAGVYILNLKAAGGNKVISFAIRK